MLEAIRTIKAAEPCYSLSVCEVCQQASSGRSNAAFGDRRQQATIYGRISDESEPDCANVGVPGQWLRPLEAICCPRLSGYKLETVSRHPHLRCSAYKLSAQEDSYLSTVVLQLSLPPDKYPQTLLNFRPAKALGTTKQR